MLQRLVSLTPTFAEGLYAVAGLPPSALGNEAPGAPAAAAGTVTARTAVFAAPSSATLMPDVTLFHDFDQQADQSHAAALLPSRRNAGGTAVAAEAAWRPEGPVVCVELKPKWGFSSTCPTVRPQDAAIKRGASRFSLYHLLKGERGEMGVPSRQGLIVTEFEQIFV